jgi:hypothetical protein
MMDGDTSSRYSLQKSVRVERQLNAFVPWQRIIILVVSTSPSPCKTIILVALVLVKLLQ